MSDKKDPVVIERRAIREAGRRRLRGEGPTSPSGKDAGSNRIYRYRHGINGDVSNSMAFNPLIHSKDKEKK